MISLSIVSHLLSHREICDFGITPPVNIISLVDVMCELYL